MTTLDTKEIYNLSTSSAGNPNNIVLGNAAIMAKVFGKTNEQVAKEVAELITQTALIEPTMGVKTVDEVLKSIDGTTVLYQKFRNGIGNIIGSYMSVPDYDFSTFGHHEVMGRNIFMSYMTGLTIAEEFRGHKVTIRKTEYSLSRLLELFTDLYHFAPKGYVELNGGLTANPRVYSGVFHNGGFETKLPGYDNHSGEDLFHHAISALGEQIAAAGGKGMPKEMVDKLLMFFMTVDKNGAFNSPEEYNKFCKEVEKHFNNGCEHFYETAAYMQYPERIELEKIKNQFTDGKRGAKARPIDFTKLKEFLQKEEASRFIELFNKHAEILSYEGYKEKYLLAGEYEKIKNMVEQLK